MHEVPRASGEGMRPTDVRDAKRLGLLPSVTNILGGLAKPGIDAWKRNQLVRRRWRCLGWKASRTPITLLG